ncbi:hypothetical protein HOE91_00845 [archaeon]|jgi:hypothetical protein|nr:hypothetical protein [archaeon]MBT4652306.1 hypothetical protein [Candidatus Paceibacterota bacterium]
MKSKYLIFLIILMGLFLIVSCAKDVPVEEDEILDEETEEEVEWEPEVEEPIVELISGDSQIVYDFPANIEPLSLYTTNVELEQGDWIQIATVVFNDQSDAAEYTLTTKTIDTGSGNDIDCYIADSADITDTFNLNSGAKEEEVIIIQDTGNTNLGLYVCAVELYRDNEQIEDQTIAIEIV